MSNRTLSTTAREAIHNFTHYAALVAAELWLKSKLKGPGSHSLLAFDNLMTRRLNHPCARACQQRSCQIRSHHNQLRQQHRHVDTDDAP